MKWNLLIFLSLISWLSEAQSSWDSIALDTMTINGSELDQSGHYHDLQGKNQYNSLQELILNNSSGYARNYSPGQSSTLHILGATSSQSKVLWNKIDISNSMLGLMDLSIIPISFFQNTRIDYMPDAENQAIGGVVNLGSESNPSNRFSLGTGYSSLNNFYISSLWTKVLKKSSHTLKLHGLYAQNKYTLALPGYKYEMEYADQNALNFAYNYKGALKKWKLSQSLWYSQSERQIPNPSGSNSFNDRQKDENLRYQITVNRGFNKHFIELQMAYLRDLIYFQNDNIDTPGLSQKLVGRFNLQSSISKYFLYKSQYRFSPIWGDHPNYLQKTQLNYTVDLFQGIEYQRKRILFKSYISTEYSSLSMNSKFVVNPLWDLILQFGPSQVLFQVHRASRFPTLNDLNWSPGGNPNLLAEKAWKYSASYGLKFSDFTFKIHGYYRKTDNMIQWIPTGSFWSPQNILKVKTQGIQFESQYSFNISQTIKAQLRESVNYIESVNDDKESPHYGKQLIYTPKAKWDNRLELNFKNVGLSYHSQWVSRRNTSSDGFAFLSAYFVQDIHLFYTHKLSQKQEISANLALKNLGNAFYQHQAGYFQAGRHLEINITYNH